MPIEFKLPELGEGIKSADIAGISVKEGDVIEPDQNVLELETDKAVVELPCPTGGKLLQIHVKQGQSVTPGTLIFTLEGAASVPAPAKAAPAPAASKPAAPAPAASNGNGATAKPAAAPAVAAKPAASAPAAGGTQVFKLPNLGEGIKSADISSISVKVGDTITADQNIMELETDKAVVELPCSIAGQITEVHVAAGATVKPGDPILTLTTSASAPAAAAPSPKTPAEAPASTPAPSTKSATSAKPAVEPTSPTAVNVAPVATPSELVPANEKRAPAPAGPATRRLARKLGADLYEIKGSGPGGRITQDDVQGYIRQIMEGAKTAPKAPAAAAAPAVATPKLPDFQQFGTIERKAMSRIAKTTAANLSYAWQTIPHVTQHDLADVTELEAGRKRHTQNQKSGAKITMTVLAIKAVVAALKQYPHFNSSIDTATEEIVLKQYYHVGVAVDTEFGLVVPVIRDVNHKSILEIAKELDTLATKARERKLSPSDFQGGTFTITNLGGIGGTTFSPIVNWPEVAILGMSRAKQQLVVTEGEPKVRLMLPLSLSYDHRVINGADAARFITKVSGLLADPSQLLIES